MNISIYKKSITIACCLLFLSTIFIPVISADTNNNYPSFSKGVSYKPVVPLEKVTFVQSDESSYLDDYSYLAAVPTAVFTEENQIFSHPLLLFDDTIYYEEEKFTLNAKEGIDYFMEDWMGFCNNRLDEITLINVDKKDLEATWKTDEYNTIKGENPYDIASDLALHDWSYSDEVVIAVIQDETDQNHVTIENSVQGSLGSGNINTDTSFSLEQTNSLNPTFYDFKVSEEYVFIQAETWWDCLITKNGMMFPTGDPDIQLYCEQQEGWMQAAAASFWNVYHPQGREYTQAHVYEHGNWRVGITDLPTEGEAPERTIGKNILQGSLLEVLKPGVTYHVDITKYPGTIIELPNTPPFGCKDARFTITWDDADINLGISIIGPGGEVIVTELNETEDAVRNIHFNTLGQCLTEEYYSVSVFPLEDLTYPLDFEITYEWNQNISQKTSDALTSATQGAVLASMLNAPLLYTTPTQLPEITKTTLVQLGVKNLHIINLGNHMKQTIKDQLQSITTITEYTTHDEFYQTIQSKSDSQDIVFSTIDPWTYWYLGELEPHGETEASLFIGPAAYLAAHHGTPVFIVDNHPLLSSAVVWHNEFWKRFASNRYLYPPSTAEMVLTGKRIYQFLDQYGFDKQGQENIITVADQYDIGVPWDRIFPGVAHAGRICGSPIDTSYWISRNVFYPALLFENPALNQELTMINGSMSRRGFEGVFGTRFRQSFLTLNIGNYQILRESGPENYEYPVQCSFVVHRHRFNERASNYYGTTYQCADGLTPGETSTMEPIDMGSIEKYTGLTGSYFPDLTESEIVPFYLEKGGYDPVFSTNLDSVMDNVNNGVILWIHIAHGNEHDGGSAEFWDPYEGFQKWPALAKIAIPLQKIPLMSALPFKVLTDENPWRGYEWLLGSTDEPDTMTMDIYGMFPFTNLKIPGLPASGQDWVLAKKPFKELFNNLIPFIDPFNVDNLYDGVIATAYFSRLQNSFKEALEVNDQLENLHSAGFITSMCQTSNTYLHLSLIRHGSVFQVQDPWPTSWYGAVWRQTIPRDIALGSTIGEAYSKGISHVGSLYISDPPQWWWDTAENVVFFGDPSLRIYVPDTTYSDANTWERPTSLHTEESLIIDGHTPYGAEEYPHELETNILSNYLIYLVLICLAIVVIILLIKNKKISKK